MARYLRNGNFANLWQRKLRKRAARAADALIRMERFLDALACYKHVQDLPLIKAGGYFAVANASRSKWSHSMAACSIRGLRKDVLRLNSINAQESNRWERQLYFVSAI